jgi:salicylate hydroxylase
VYSSSEEKVFQFMSKNVQSAPVLIVGGGIGGLAAALALSKQGVASTIFEQAPELGEIGAGIQLGPNAFAAFDALGLGERARTRAVYTDDLIMCDAVDAKVVVKIPTGQAFRDRFDNPYAVIHRADMHQSLLEAAKESDHVEFLTSTRIERIETLANGVRVYDQNNRAFDGQALIGADGVKSVVRQHFVADPHRVTGHVVYRAVVPVQEFPKELQWNAAALWVGPNCHLVHYPLKGGEQYNVVVTFHSRQTEEWGVTEGSQAEVQSYFEGVCPQARQLIDLPKSWRRWATADRDPIAQWSFGRSTLLGDAAHPTTQYMAQGACMAMEDAVTLAECLRVCAHDWVRALDLYQRARVARTARIVLSSREMGKLYHASGVERLVRNDLWRGRSTERFFDALEWLYGWKHANCLSGVQA